MSIIVTVPVDCECWDHMSRGNSHSGKTGANSTLEPALLTIAYVLIVIGVPLVCTDLAFHPFASPKLMILVVAAACSCLALSIKLAAPSARRFGLLTLIVLALVVTASLSFLSSATPGPSLWGSYKQDVGFLAAMASLAIGVAFATAIKQNLPLDTSYLWALPIASSALLSLVVIAGIAGAPMPDFLAPGGTGIVRGTVGLTSALSSLLSAFAVYSIGQAVVRGPRWRPAIVTGAVLALATAVVAGWLPGLLGFAVGATVMLVRWAVHSHQARLSIAGAGLAVVAGLIVALAVQPDYVTPPGATGGWDWMAEVYRSAGRMAGRNLMFGEGPASFQPGLISLLTPEAVRTYFSQTLPGDAHNWLLEFASTYGVPCAMIVAYLIVRPFTVLNRIPRAAAPYTCAALSLVIAGMFGPLSLSTLPVLALFIGITCAATGAEHPQPAASDRLERTSAKHAYRLFSRMAALTAVVTAGIFLVLGSHFLRDEIDSRYADLTNNLAMAEAAAERLRPPTAPGFWSAARIAAFDARIGADPSAAASVDSLMKQAKAVDPRDPNTEFNWAVSLQMLERHHDAIDHLAEGLRLYPSWPLALKGIAFSYIDLGHAREALAILEPLVDTYPEDAAARRLLDSARGVATGD